jgi:hypothetical protein
MTMTTTTDARPQSELPEWTPPTIEDVGPVEEFALAGANDSCSDRSQRGCLGQVIGDIP